MPQKLVTGVYAAVGTPRTAFGKLDEDAFRRSLEFLMERGIRGFAVNGATGEFCLSTCDDVRRLVAIARQATAGTAEFICGIGSAGIWGCLERGAIALGGGAKGLLLPMPEFFPYQQEDLDEFCRQVALELTGPILLYNLPQFTTGLAAETVQHLILSVPNIVGIKDSNGSLDILRALTQEGIDACRIVGNDSMLAQALNEGVCDAVVSGVAGALPELILKVFGQGTPGDAGFPEATRALDAFIEQLNRFPVPWGVKLIAESRGMAPASFSQPLSPHRRTQGREFQAWFREWWPAAGASLSTPPSPEV